MSEDDRPQQEDDEDSDAYGERRDEWESSIRRVVLPNPGKFIAPEPTEVGSLAISIGFPLLYPSLSQRSFSDVDMQYGDLVDLKRDYASQGLQIIVKLANIELTPNKPTYEGGSWHVEGQLVSPTSRFSIYGILKVPPVDPIKVSWLLN
jgi:hypothetical protein